MSKLLPGQSYACPKCKRPLIKDKSFDIYHCFPCNSSVDLWHDPEPEIIDLSALLEEDKI